MKTMKKLFFSTLALLLFSGFFSITLASEKELQKTYTWKYNITKDGNVVLDNYDCNMTIHTWDKAETEFHLVIDANTRSDEDATVLDTYLQNLKFNNSSSSVRFGNTFWETRNNIMGRMTMKLEGGKTVGLSEFSMKGELWIPATCRFELDSKYSEINIEDFSGQLKLDVYNDNIYGGNVNGKANITDKYSTLQFKEMKDIEADLYNSKLEAKSMGSLKIVSKYTKVTAETVGNLDADSYNDKYSFTRTGDIIFLAKYSDIKSDISGQINLDCYEGTIFLKEVKDVKISSKYADFQFTTAGNITISSSYNDKLSAGKLTSLKIDDSKYCNFKIEELVSSVIESDGYEDKFIIGKTGQEFKELNINGKYIEISLGLPKTIDYKFKAKIQYPKLDINESVLTSKDKVLEGDNLTYDAVKGTVKDGMPRIVVTGYEMGLKIVEL
jgi:hypothetical protein